MAMLLRRGRVLAGQWSWRFPAVAGSPPRRTASHVPGLVWLEMPALSPTMTHGNIGAWHKVVGDKIEPGEAIVAIETDKAEVEFESLEEGYLAAVYVQEGETDVPIGRALGLMVEDQENIEAAKSLPAPAAQEDSSSASIPTPTQASASAPSASSAPPRERASSSPHVRTPLIKFRYGGNRGADVASLSRHPETLKPQSMTERRSTSSAADNVVRPHGKPRLGRIDRKSSDAFSEHKVTTMRKVIAKRLTESKTTVPHAYSTAECQIDALMGLRNSIKARGDRPASVNDYIVRASALALRDVPEANAKWDAANECVVPESAIDISVAVATEGGLITPIVKDAVNQTVESISADIKDLAGRARSNKLRPHEYQGGSFTISNLGMFGITEFSAVLNPPQACILAVGGGQTHVVPESEGSDVPKVISTMKVTLSCDRRVLDESVAGRWLEAFKGHIEQPENLQA